VLFLQPDILLEIIEACPDIPDSSSDQLVETG
jgi:hypothetical protein